MTSLAARLTLTEVAARGMCLRLPAPSRRRSSPSLRPVSIRHPLAGEIVEQDLPHLLAAELVTVEPVRPALEDVRVLGLDPLAHGQASSWSSRVTRRDTINYSAACTSKTSLSPPSTS